MAIDLMNYQPAGDKKNSDMFNEYRLKIFEWRQSSGLQDIIQHIRALVIQVETDDALDYINELYFMTPYRYAASYRDNVHNIYILENMHGKEMPLYIILEPLSKNHIDDITRINAQYPLSKDKPNARYIGEMFHVSDLKAATKILGSHDIAFHSAKTDGSTIYDNANFRFTATSPYTHNRFGYSECDLCDYDRLQLGERFEPDAATQDRLAKTDAWFREKGLDKMLLGVDHMATRVLSSDRESAILEFLTCSNYYFWGAYNIDSENSSTNVNRHPAVKTDRLSPAKVFTANNTPYFINAFVGSPMPTENFVLNLGPRMHHIAQEVVDGDHGDEKNIDFAVNTIKEQKIKFLAKIVGECKDKPDLKQIFSKRSAYSLLITEYIERCHGFDGFFTKHNVAALTAAAGQDEIVAHGKVFD